LSEQKIKNTKNTSLKVTKILCTHIIIIEKNYVSITKAGWQWMHVNVQIVLVGCACQAEKRKEPQPEDRIVSLLVVINIDW
jgi:hypothetical protein